ncbi:MAG: alpha-galactosidase [Acidimicrobiia bacterium]
MRTLVHLAGPTASVIVDVASGVPAVLHWGCPLADDTDLDALADAIARPIAGGALDVEPPITLVPLHGDGFAGRPGLLGRARGGVAWAPRFAGGEHRLLANDGAGAEAFSARLEVVAEDAVAGLRLRTVLGLAPGGALLARAELTNTGPSRYLLDALTITLPVPAQASELLGYTGRWTRELQLQRSPWTHGARITENRAGRTSHEHPPLVWAVTPGAGEWHGEVWGAHLAWSGNHVIVAECLPDGRRYLQLGELLHPGEVCLETGDRYETPWVVASYAGHGLTPASWAFHRHVRSRPNHPRPERPRPVLLNTWEAVYFDHDTERLKRLAEAAAALGIERFVLDDGWFGSRRDDRRGLGDWWVSPEVYPDGLAPLIDHVRGLGMEFGIWVEPEMVNPDSDLYRAHPEWALDTPGYEPVLGRHQLVLDLARPEAFAHVFGQLDALLSDHDIAYVKWDMNRNHVQGSGANGAAGTRAQTIALYRLLDELRARHPAVEIESCSSGGARIDHEILARTERVWTSDCNDALERQAIQRGASMFIPPEVMGAHIGPTRSHTTGRRHSIGFRAATAIFGHLGVEWNVLDLDDEERAALREVIALHHRFRPLLHGGDAVRFDLAPNGPGGDGAPDAIAYGVYAVERNEALVCFAQLRSGMSLTPPPLRLPGLAPDRRYVVRHVPLPGGLRGTSRRLPEWLVDPGAELVLTGAQLAAHGIQPPVLWPETAMLLHLST